VASTPTQRNTLRSSDDLLRVALVLLAPMVALIKPLIKLDTPGPSSFLCSNGWEPNYA